MANNIDSRAYTSQGFEVARATSNAASLNRQETYDLRDALRYGEQFANILQDLTAHQRANGRDEINPSDDLRGIDGTDLSGRYQHPDDDSILDIYNRAIAEGGPLANFLQSKDINFTADTPISTEDVETIATQLRAWSTQVRDTLPSSTRNSGLEWDPKARNFFLDGKKVTLRAAFASVRFKQQGQVLATLAFTLNSIDLRNVNVRELQDVEANLREFLTEPAWDVALEVNSKTSLDATGFYAERRNTLPIKDGTNRHETYDEYFTRINQEFYEKTGTSLLDQLGSQGITSFYDEGDDNVEPKQIERSYVERLVDAISEQTTSLLDDNAIAAQQQQRLEDRSRTIYTGISSFINSDTSLSQNISGQI